MVIANFKVWKIMVDSKSATDVFLYDAFKVMKLSKETLMPVQCPLYRFNGEAIMLERVIILTMTLGVEPKHLNLMIDFSFIRVPSAYNAFLGHP